MCSRGECGSATLCIGGCAHSSSLMPVTPCTLWCTLLMHKVKCKPALRRSLSWAARLRGHATTTQWVRVCVNRMAQSISRCSEARGAAMRACGVRCLFHWVAALQACAALARCTLGCASCCSLVASGCFPLCCLVRWLRRRRVWRACTCQALQRPAANLLHTWPPPATFPPLARPATKFAQCPAARVPQFPATAHKCALLWCSRYCLQAPQPSLCSALRASCRSGGRWCTWCRCTRCATRALPAARLPLCCLVGRQVGHMVSLHGVGGSRLVHLPPHAHLLTMFKPSCCLHRCGSPTCP